jgi:Trypsin-co-occurring domain 1
MEEAYETSGGVSPQRGRQHFHPDRESETDGTVRATRGDSIEKARETFEDALNRVLPATVSVVEHLQSMSNKPSEIEAAFGIIWSLQAGAFITAGSDANFAVTRTGQKKRKLPPLPGYQDYKPYSHSVQGVPHPWRSFLQRVHFHYRTIHHFWRLDIGRTDRKLLNTFRKVLSLTTANET